MKNHLIASGETSVSSPNSSDESDHNTTPLLVDEDTCSRKELDSLFQTKWSIADEAAVSLQKEYILDLAADSGFTRVAAGLSSGDVRLFDINTSRTLSICADIPDAASNRQTAICGVRYLDETPNCLLVGSKSGVVRLFDLRTQKEEVRFEENIEFTRGIGNFGGGDKGMNQPKEINCFDINSNGRILCTGTQQIHGNVFLLFYDVRKRTQLGGYYECHEDDITALRFHATNPDLMCSGSTDGLINVYDIKETTEEGALLTTLNTESSVHKINWHKNVYEQDLISCITHPNDFHIYLAEEGDRVAKFERSQITAAAMRTNEANCNVIDAHSLENGDIFLLTGTNNNKGEVMRTLRFNNNLMPLADFNGNKQIVRSSIFDKKHGALLTGGECGIVTLWTTDMSTNNDIPTLDNSSNGLKHKSKKSKRKTPY